MEITVEFWQLIGIAGGVLTAFISVIFAAGKLFLSQLERRLDGRFKSLDSRFGTLEQAFASDAKEWQRIEREILLMKADMPVQYVRRDDYIRNQTIIEAKIDGLAVRIENALLKGNQHG
ncbi:MAG: hypothetical protein Q8M20_18085 [Rhodocyclaceae bacterium]|nr:hypothetical protein [Rhodocyclaceae bacterium]